MNQLITRSDAVRSPAPQAVLRALQAALWLALLAGCEAAPAAPTPAEDVPAGVSDAVADAAADTLTDSLADAVDDSLADTVADAQTDALQGSDTVDVADDVALDVAAGTDASQPDTAQPDTTLPDAVCAGANGCPCAVAADCDSAYCATTPDGKRCAPLCATPCVGTEVCQTDVPGTAGYCATPACAGLAEGSVCDDANVCTTQTICTAGKCAGGVSVCECGSDDDCAAKNDADLCNGSLYCDLLTNKCAVNPLTVVNCAGSPQGACEAVVCQPQTGACVVQPANEGAVCDDGDPCTETVCAAGSCSLQTQLCACQTSADCPDDTNPCNGQPFCNKATVPYTCQTNPVTVVTCLASNDPCQVSACDPQTGACSFKPAANGTPCEDGKPCTSGDTCQNGSCTAGELTCACTSQADCIGQDDGNLCNGVPYCDVVSGQCALNPATVVVCPSVDDTACLVNTCQPKTGQCAMVAVADGSICDDQNPCTEADSCQDGQCASGQSICACQTDADCPNDSNACNGQLYCDSVGKTCVLNLASVVVCEPGNNPCAPVSCDPASGACVALPVAASTACDDGDPCTPVSTCQSGSCVSGPSACQCKTDADCSVFATPDLCDGELFCNKTSGACEVNQATIPVCPTVDDTDCLANRCQPATGTCAMVPRLDGIPCNDGNACSPIDRCAGGACVAGASTCACEADADCAYLDDGNLCSGQYFCNKSGPAPVCAFNPATVVVCSQADATACLSFVCEASSGACVPQALSGPCSDNNVCTGNDTCVDAACLPGTPTSCDDGDPCTFDACNPIAGCFATPIAGGSCDDGELCTQDDICTGISCVGVPVYCDDDDPCTDDSCVPGQGCAFTANTELCDDDNACTIKDRCSAGVCKGVTRLCASQGPCLAAACLPASGCTVEPVSGPPCTDGNVCTTVDTCAAGVCTGSTPLNCDDNSVCSNDSCDPVQGCRHAPAGILPCEDGDACTTAELCWQGICQSGTPVVCDDTNPCTIDLCTPQTGCAHTPIEANCDDDNPCTINDVCLGGLCQPGPPTTCPDPTECELPGVCAPATGQCYYGPKTTGSMCSDGDPCTSTDGCDGGVCKPGPAVTCEDGNVCTTNSCSSTQGCVSVFNTLPCTDDNACTTGETCSQGVCQSGTPVVCDDDNPCTLDVCASGSGCKNVPQDVFCDDDNACTLGDICADGTCTPGTPVSCPDPATCKLPGTCNPASGTCTYANSAPNTLCSDGNACTLNEKCFFGICGSGTAVTCDDGNPCTDDSCVPASGCAKTNNTASCTDGNACTTADVCAAGVCTGSGTLACDDGNPCTDDSCAPASGCVYPNNTASCSDSKACTPSDVCSGGACTVSSGTNQRWSFEGDFHASIGGFTGSGVGLPDFATGVYGGQGLLLAGNGYVDLGASTGNLSATGWTLQFWAKFQGAGPYAILAKRTTCGNPEGGWYNISTNDQGWVGMEFSDGFTYLVASANDKAYNDNAWHHFAYVGNATSVKAYADGVLIASAAGTGLGGVTETKPLRVGTTPCVGSNPQIPYVGQVDELSIQNRAATAAEIASFALGQCVAN